jgi:hypothetical protein
VEQLPVVIPLVADGLQDNWRCLYLGSPEMVGMVGDALSSRGVDVAYETKRGALVLSSERDHLGNGTIHPGPWLKTSARSSMTPWRRVSRGFAQQAT